MKKLITDVVEILEVRYNEIEKSLKEINTNCGNWSCIETTEEEINKLFQSIERCERINRGILETKLRILYEEKIMELAEAKGRFRDIDKEDWDWLNN